MVKIWKISGTAKLKEKIGIKKLINKVFMMPSKANGEKGETQRKEEYGYKYIRIENNPILQNLLKSHLTNTRQENYAITL